MGTAILNLDVETRGTDDQRAMMAAKYLDVTVGIWHITPDVARSMLAKNRKNRNLTKRNVGLLRDAITTGEWYMNGEAIIFSSIGTLLNGQHRLHAIVLSGVGVDVLVVCGVDPESFKTLDSGRARRAGEVLAMDGEKNASQVAAAVQALFAFVDAGGKFGAGSCGGGRKATASACHRILERNEGVRESVREMKRNAMYSSQHASALHYLFSLVSKEVASDFADVLASGHSDIGRPFVVFRESLLRSPVCSENRVSHAAKAIKAFNAEVTGDRPKMLKFLKGEEFPTIHGLNYEAVAESMC
jgi:hypothetical protein